MRTTMASGCREGTTRSPACARLTPKPAQPVDKLRPTSDSWIVDESRRILRRIIRDHGNGSGELAEAAMDEELKSDLPEHEAVPVDAAAAVTERTALGTARDRMPAMYLGHGAPPLVDDPLWTTQLAAWASALPKPSAILVVSAHWEAAPLTVGATADAAPLVYDFWGFPERYYRTTYPAPGAPALAAKMRALLAGTESVAEAPDRGLDHGAYVPLTVMYPAADIPVLQVSMPTLEPGRLLRIGAALRPLRDEGVLIMG